MKPLPPPQDLRVTTAIPAAPGVQQMVASSEADGLPGIDQLSSLLHLLILTHLASGATAPIQVTTFGARWQSWSNAVALHPTGLLFLIFWAVHCLGALVMFFNT